MIEAQSQLWRRPTQQIAGLDALRAIAVLLVIADHFAVSAWPNAGGTDIALAHSPLVRFGWTGVDLFFVLSGLLIGTQLWKERERTGRIRVGRFFIRRAFRIWPLYFATLALLAVGLGSVTPRWPDWLLLSNYLGTPYARSWSLSSEEMFYLVLPAMLVLTPRWPLRRYVWLLVLLVPLVDLTRAITARELLDAGVAAARVDARMYAPFHLHNQALVVGLLIALCTVLRPDWFRRPERAGVSWAGLAVLGGACVLGLTLRTLDRQIFAFTALGLIYGGATVWVLLDRSLLSRPLQAWGFYPIARLSFGMYLNHFVIFPGTVPQAVRGLRALSLPEPAVFVGALLAGTAASAAVAAVTFVLVEHPFLALRDRLLRRRSERAVPEAVASPGR